MDHIQYVLKNDINTADFSDIKIMHNCLPKTDASKIDISSYLAGLSLATPFFLNAITGGAKETLEVNCQLAQFCKNLNIPMAVGSQKAALDDSSLVQTYKVVRDINPKGVIIANVGAYSSVDEAQCAVDMLEANALQIHLNSPQEIVMTEGDRDFSGWLKNISDICNKIEVPIIIKETGFGMARDQAKLLLEVGISALDVSGQGGTNFIEIEASRGGSSDDKFKNWGIPTPVSLIEVLDVIDNRIDVIASGGVNSSLNIIKSLSLGACAVGLAALPLKIILSKGLEESIQYFTDLLREIRNYMAILGAENIKDLKKVPLIILGDTSLWLESRGINLTKYARRDFAELS